MPGFCTGGNVSMHYRASGVILNHNYTKEFFKKDCEPCKVLADDVTQGVSFHLWVHHIHYHTTLSTMKLWIKILYLM